MMQSFIWDYIAFVIFVMSWKGYGFYAARAAKTKPCISNTLDLYREDWMRRLLKRENRISDTSVIGNLERNGAFFASSSLLIMAGILTALGYTDRAIELFNDVPFAVHNDRMMWEIKFGLLLVVFVYAFFKFTWAMRQYNFCAVLIGSAPLVDEPKVSPAAREAFACSAARVANLAGDAFNLGLRSYYFALAVLAWFVHPILFIIVSIAVVMILYHREFSSRALKGLRSGKVFEDR
ncbi:MAG: DUF599 domain-containing protein [Hahellaceae bacterium]|jgi:uncharacterized membrane protein|nr:DUF599 domain-containing protein [Hahellaceae bacterium]MCP5211973.1 DUF599 domain-containing protein [Hahellaceae bacterium]